MVFSDLKFAYIFLPVFFPAVFSHSPALFQPVCFFASLVSTLWEHWTARCMPCFSLPIYS